MIWYHTHYITTSLFYTHLITTFLSLNHQETDNYLKTPAREGFNKYHWISGRLGALKESKNLSAESTTVRRLKSYPSSLLRGKTKLTCNHSDWSFMSSSFLAHPWCVNLPCLSIKMPNGSLLLVLRLFLGAVKHNQSLKSWQGFHPQMNYWIIKHGPPLFATYLHVQEAFQLYNIASFEWVKGNSLTSPCSPTNLDALPHSNPNSYQLLQDFATTVYSIVS